MSPFPRDLSGTLAFQSDVRTASNPNGRVKIYTIDLATGRVSAMTRDGDWNDEQPRWSPDGQRIAFTSNRGGSYNLYVMDADGGNVSRVTNHGGNDHDPVWLPDGQSLVFGSDRDRGIGRSDLYRLLARGWRRRAADDVFRGLRVHAERVAGRQLGRLRRRRRSRTDFGWTSTRCTSWNWRRG